MLTIGKSYSAEDIASQIHKFGANKVLFSHRAKDADGNWVATGLKWPDGVEERPLIKNVEGKTVTF